MEPNPFKRDERQEARAWQLEALTVVVCFGGIAVSIGWAVARKLGWL